MTPAPTLQPLRRAWIARLAGRIARFWREQRAHETQAELNRRLANLHHPRTVRPGHICAPAVATAGGRLDDPLEALWRIPARRPRRVLEH